MRIHYRNSHVYVSSLTVFNLNFHMVGVKVMMEGSDKESQHGRNDHMTVMFQA